MLLKKLQHAMLPCTKVRGATEGCLLLHTCWLVYTQGQAAYMAGRRYMAYIQAATGW